MAEAPPWPSRFFCHRCSVEIIPRLPDYTCPRCDSGFIEELLEERSADNGSMSTISSGPQNQQPSENPEQHLFTFSSGNGQFALGVFGNSFDLGAGLGTEDNRDAENHRERETAARHRYGARQQRRLHGSMRPPGWQEDVPTLEGIIQQLVNGIIAPTAMPNLGVGPWGVLHSNPMDYAWGANGLDAIITQLLNQFENTGPPPADGDRIRSLPTIQITAEHVVSGLECPVCKEDYSVAENVRQLPCSHMFHNNCIVPWLEQSAPNSKENVNNIQICKESAGPRGEEPIVHIYSGRGNLQRHRENMQTPHRKAQHDTCPVCRKSLSGQNTATNPPELSGMNFNATSSSNSSSSSSSSSSSTPQSSSSTSNNSSSDNP